MRFRYALLALLWTTTAAQAASLVITSDPDAADGRGLLPQTLSQELRRSGAGPAPRIEVGLGYALREVKVSSVVCETQAGGADARCLFSLPNSTARLPALDSSALYSALSRLSEGAEALPLKSCDSTGACRISVTAVYCLENSRMSEKERGKFVCGVVGG